jgi:hypothetical protein
MFDNIRTQIISATESAERVERLYREYSDSASNLVRDMANNKTRADEKLTSDQFTDDEKEKIKKEYDIVLKANKDKLFSLESNIIRIEKLKTDIANQVRNIDESFETIRKVKILW